MTNNENGNAPKQGLRVTSAKEWKRLRKEGVLVELPSGMVARLRPVSIIDLWRSSGSIPDGLTAIIGDLLVNGTVSAQKSEMTAELITSIAELYTMVCRAAFVEPAIVDSPRDNAEEIALEDLSQADREFTLAWVSTPTTELKPFLTEQGQSLESVEPSAGVRSKAKSDT